MDDSPFLVPIDKAQAAGDQKAFSELNDLAGMLR